MRSSNVSSSTIVGSQDRVLELARQNQHVSVLLLYGERGSGIDQIAEQFAKIWFAAERDPESVNLDKIVDFLRIEPQGASSWILTESIRPTKSRRSNTDELSESGSSSAKQAETLSVLEFLRTRPLVAPCKVVLISRPDRLQPRAANSFLKLLEEIQPYGRIVMATYDIGRVLSTIRSRALCISVPTVDNADGRDDLAAVFGKTPGDYEFIQQHREIFQDLQAVLDSLAGKPPLYSLSASETCRSLGEQLAAASKEGVRDSHVRILESIGNWLHKQNPSDWQTSQQVSQAAGLIMSNSNASNVYDLLLGKFLVQNLRN